MIEDGPPTTEEHKALSHWVECWRMEWIQHTEIPISQPAGGGVEYIQLSEGYDSFLPSSLSE